MKKFDLIFICPKFYNYEELILSSLIKKGLVVKSVFYDETDVFKLHILSRILLFLFRITLSLLGGDACMNVKYGRVKDYLVIRQCSKKFNMYVTNSLCGVSADKLLVIKGFCMDANTLHNIKAKKKILFQWDSLIRYPSVIGIYNKFDSVFTFDKSDSENGYGFFLPNFFKQNEVKPNNYPCQHIFDISFVGTYTWQRYKILRRLKSACEKMGLNYYFHLYSLNKFNLLFGNGIVKDYSVDNDFYQQILQSSSCLVEICHFGQSGATQRVFDGLSKGKIIISNSNNDYGFPTHCHSIDDFISWNKKQYLSVVLAGKQMDLDEKLKQYELDSWLKTLLN